VSLLIASELSLSFGSKVILEGANLTIGPSDRVGLVGANGTGKSTLLKILVGQQALDHGKLTFRRNARVGYLPQDLQALPEGGLVDAVLSTVPGRDGLDGRLAETEAALDGSRDPDEQMELATLLSELHEERDHFDEHFGRHRAERILLGLGFRVREFEQPTATFSGGWRMRAALAGLLLQDPDLLLLDEPTNHLDLPTQTWFDAFMRRSRKAMVLISHDREFLNRQVSKVVSLETEGLRTWSGNYEDYRRQRAEEYERLLAQAGKVAAKRAQLETFINRFRAKASKAAQAQSKMKQLAKMETVQLHQARDTVSFTFPTVAQPGRDVARFINVNKAFGDNVIYEGLNGTVLRGQRIAAVGLNGAGKTTLLKLLAGELTPDRGSVELGHNVVLGYYAQHHGDTLDRTRTVLEEMMALVPDKPQAFVRSVLGSFLFSGDDVEKRIGVLSGGERARVALARLLLKPANLLVMDEPTNHLDLDSSEALIEALEGYEGTLVFVSHNRSFLDALATHVWDVREKKVVQYPGNLAEYLEHLELESARDQDPREDEATARAKSPEKERKRLEAQARQARSQKVGPLKKEIARMEARIAELEGAQKVREAQLVDPAFAADFAKARPVLDAHRVAAAELEQLYARWEEASASLATLTD
jgi:ATP-binding cassette subfamily F protein 3